MRSILRVLAALVAAVLTLAFGPGLAQAQKALVYCPTDEAASCSTVAAALTAGGGFSAGVDKGYDGTDGTVDLKTVDLFTYSVIFIPSLSDDATYQPYGLLRDPAVQARLAAATLGRRAFYSGTPDLGSSNRASKDALISSLAKWAAANYAAVRAPGLVALQDQSDDQASQYKWSLGITGVQMVTDPKPASYDSVRTTSAAGMTILSSGGTQLKYGNMASFGFYFPNGAAGVSMDAVGQTGTTVGGTVVLVTSEGANTGGAVIKTDKDDYAPGTTVVMTGTGFGANEQVSLVLHEDPLVDNDRTFTTTADGNGGFTFTGFAPEAHDLNVRFILTALGKTSGKRAQTTFTDNTSFNSNSVSVSAQSPSPVAAGNSATYTVTVKFNGNAANGTTGCTLGLSVISALPSGAAASFSPSTLNATSAVDRTSTLTITTTAASPLTNAATLTVEARGTGGTGNECLTTSAATGSGTLSIGTPTTLGTTTTGANASSTYGAASVLLTATVSPASGPVVNTGTVTFTIKSGATTIGTVTSGPVTAGAASASFPLTGVNASSYTITAAYSGATGLGTSNNATQSPAPTLTVSPKSLTGNFTAANKPYDGTVAATIGGRTLSGVVGSDVVTLTGGTATFADKNVGSGKTVTGTGFSLTGAAATNYTLASVTLTTTANITARALAVTATGVNKAYDGTTTATVTLADDRIAGDVFTAAYTTATFADKNVGTAKPVSVSGISISGTDAGNYTANTTTSTTANITGITLTPSFTATNKPYDGTNAATIVTRSVAGKQGTDAVTLAGGTATFADKNVGTGKTVTASGFTLEGADAGNYTLPATPVTTTANITARPLVVSAVGVNKVYDGATTATVTLSDDRVTGDVLTTAFATAAFADKNVGTNKAVSVSGITISGADATNYTANTTASTTASITALALTGSITASNKTYDGTTAATITTRSLTGTVSGDAVSFAGGAATFADKNVGTGKTVTATGLALSGADAGNYTVNATATTTADITKKGVTGSVTTANKVYDGGTTATAAAGSGTLVVTGAIAGDAVTLTGGTLAFGDKNVGSAKTVTASGWSLGGADAGNYTLGTVTASVADITTLAITGSVTASSKVYDGNATATILTRSLTGAVSGDNVTYSGGSATFGDKNVGAGKTVTATGLALSGSDAGNYTVNATATTTADVTKKALVVAAAGVNKAYDGTTAATVTLSTDKLAGDAVTATYGTATFADKNVGTGKPVSVSGIALGGSDGGNYSFNATGSTTADITARALVVSATGVSRAYDGTTAATVTLTDNRVAGDVLTAAYTTATFADKNVGAARTVSVSGISISGTDAGNYTFNATASTTADITKRALVVTATGVNKVYDGTTAATVTLADNRIAGDVFSASYATATFADKNVGAGKSIGVSGISLAGADAGNYTPNPSATATADITARALVVSAAGVSKVYDGTTAATVTLSDTRVAGDVFTVSLGSATFADRHVGTAKLVSVTGISLSGADAGNYTVNATASTTADITALAIVGSITANDKVYDGTTTAVIASHTLSGQVAGDAVSYTGGTATFGTKAVGTGKTVTATGLSLTGADAGDYTVNTTATTTASITARPLVVSATGIDKVYDGTAAATVTLSSNKVAGDDVTPSYATATFGDKNVGSGKAISVTGIALSGADAGNYTFNTSAAATANITARVLVVSATGTNKVYDGTAAATVTLSDNRVSGDVLTLAYTAATFNNKNVGTAKSISVSGIGVTGADAGNYTFNATASSTADITAKALTVTAVGVNKIYDGTTTATVTLSDNRISGDVFTDSYASASFGDKNVGTGKPVSVSGISISGTDAGNYTASATASTTANITARPLVVSAAGVNKTYDGNTSATVTLSDDRVAGEVFTAAYTTAAFANKNVGTAKPVSVSGIAISGADAGNYTANTTASTTANITALAITGSVTAGNKVYDGNMTATIATRTLTGVVSGDVVGYTGGTATFADKNVGNGKTVSAIGLSLDGSDAGNYTVNATASTTADITARALLISATGVNKVYDATTAATVTLSDNRVSGDVLTAAYTTATFADKAVGTGKTISVSGLSISGADAGNYTFNATTSTTADITPLAITGAITASNKVYDGTTAATIVTRSLSGQVSGDAVSYTGGTAVFVNKNVGAGKTVSATGLGLTGADAGNYTVNAAATTMADITARPLAVTATGVNKIYDGTTTATVTLSDNRISGDVFTDSYASASFGDKNVGTGKPVSVSGISISGTDAGNYTASATASTTANITARPVTVKVTDQADLTWTGAVLTPAPFAITITSGSLGTGDIPATLGAPTFAVTPTVVKDVGTYVISVTGGLTNANYDVTKLTGTLRVVDQSAPTATITELNPVQIGGIATLKVNITDVATGNSNIVSWQYTIDGLQLTTLAASPSQPNVNLQTAISAGGTTDVKRVCVIGKDAGNNLSVETCALLAVYDPSAGFVTGGGWITSPDDACNLSLLAACLDPATGKSIVSKAHFGFVAKYQKGQQKPSGDTEFQFQAAKLNFKSTAYEWLVIGGTTSAQFKGTGTINGAGNYGFLLSAVDGDNYGNKKPDSFRIKIWVINADGTAGTTVYDNKMGGSDTDPSVATTLGGGSIQIQSK